MVFPNLGAGPPLMVLRGSCPLFVVLFSTLRTGNMVKCRGLPPAVCWPAREEGSNPVGSTGPFGTLLMSTTAAIHKRHVAHQRREPAELSMPYLDKPIAPAMHLQALGSSKPGKP